MQDFGGVLVFILLATENESINAVLTKIARVIWVKDIPRAINLASEEEFDDVLISEPLIIMKSFE